MHFTFLGTPLPFSAAAAPLSIPTDSVTGFPFLYILAATLIKIMKSNIFLTFRTLSGTDHWNVPPCLPSNPKCTPSRACKASNSPSNTEPRDSAHHLGNGVQSGVYPDPLLLFLLTAGSGAIQCCSFIKSW